MIVGFAPLNAERTAIHYYLISSRSISSNRSSHCGGTSPRTTCHSNAAATLPHPHSYTILAHLSKLDVATLRECLMILQTAAFESNINAIDILYKHNKMRIAH